MATEDTVLTHITEARTDAHALDIANQVKPTVLRKVADLLYIDPDGHGVKWLRAAIVREARS